VTQVSSSDPIAALEIGTSRTVLAVGETLAPGRIKVTAVAEIPSTGVRKSQIIDIAQAGISIESVQRRVEELAGYTINQALLAVSGPHIHTKTSTVQLQLSGPVVTDEDLAEIYNLSCTTDVDPAERTILDISELGYGLDSMEGISQPKGMTGNLLRLRTLCIHGDAQRIADARAAADAKAKLAISEPYFAASCAATAVLGPEARRDGAVTIDLGGGSTGYTVWIDGHLVRANVLGVGGDHVTNDVSHALGLSRSQAEQIKREANAMIGESKGSPRIEVPSTTPGFNAASISRRSLDTVVNARLHETFAIIRTELDRANMLHRIHSGIFLTGGGSAQNGVARLASNVFGLPARIGTLLPGIEGLEKKEHPAAYATIAGLLLAAQRNIGPESIFAPIKRIFGGIFGK